MNLPEWLDEDSSCIYDKQGHAVSLDVFAAAVVEDYKASLKPWTLEGTAEELCAAAYRAGQEAMRESAAQLVELEYAKDHQGVLRLKQIASHIRKLRDLP